jgi:hypothetical protein
VTEILIKEWCTEGYTLHVNHSGYKEMELVKEYRVWKSHPAYLAKFRSNGYLTSRATNIYLYSMSDLALGDDRERTSRKHKVMKRDIKKRTPMQHVSNCILLTRFTFLQLYPT